MLFCIRKANILHTQRSQTAHWFHCHARKSCIEHVEREPQTLSVEKVWKFQLGGIHATFRMEQHQKHLVIQALDSASYSSNKDHTGIERWRCDWKPRVCTDEWSIKHLSRDWNKQADEWSHRYWSSYWNQWIYVDKFGFKYWSDTWGQWIYFDESGKYLFYEEPIPCPGYASQWVIHDLTSGYAEPRVQISVPVSMFGPGMFDSVLRAGRACSEAHRLPSDTDVCEYAIAM